MDTFILQYFNRTLAHPFLDFLMLALTYGGLGLLPGLGIALLRAKHRRVGQAILVGMVVSVALTLVCQAVALRPRPHDVRLLLPTPNFPSFPSGHAAAAFATAVVLSLAFRHKRVWWGALTVASLIGLSRVYLGLHYPTDILGGAVLGAAVGAANYGLIVKRDWRWLLWPQAALVFIVSEIAYLDLNPTVIRLFPFADKMLHALLFGAVAFWLNLWLNHQATHWRRLAPLAIMTLFSLVALEESLQSLSPVRTFDLWDLASDLIGMLAFWWLSQRLLQLRLISSFEYANGELRASPKCDLKEKPHR